MAKHKQRGQIETGIVCPDLVIFLRERSEGVRQRSAQIISGQYLRDRIELGISAAVSIARSIACVFVQLKDRQVPVFAVLSG